MRTPLLKYATLLLLVGCASTGEFVRDIDQLYQKTTGTFIAPILGGTPRPSGCTESRCIELERFETRGFRMAREGEIKWVQMVDGFYDLRYVIFSETSDTQEVAEIRAFQRVTAEALDRGKITEAQWAYGVEKKLGEMSQRRAAARPIRCTTKNVSTADFPIYKTDCL